MRYLFFIVALFLSLLFYQPASDLKIPSAALEGLKNPYDVPNVRLRAFSNLPPCIW